MPLNLAQVMAWDMDDEDHVCSLSEQVNYSHAWSINELTAAVPKTL